MTKEEQEALRASELELREVQLQLARESGRLAWVIADDCRRRLAMVDETISLVRDARLRAALADVRKKQQEASERNARLAIEGHRATNEACGVHMDTEAVVALAMLSDVEDVFLTAMLGLVRLEAPAMEPEELLSMHLGVRVGRGGGEA